MRATSTRHPDADGEPVDQKNYGKFLTYYDTYESYIDTSS
jgi:hypothetical protein